MRKILIGFLIFAIFLGTFFLILPCQKSGFFQVKAGENLSQIAQNLKKEGFVKTEIPFYFYILLRGKARELKPGVYQTVSADSFFSLANKIIEGKSYKIKITIPEGFDLKEIQQRLIKNEVLKEAALEKLKIIDFKNEFDFLKSAPEEASLEGFLFPQTYFFDPQMNRFKVAELFLKNFGENLSQDLRDEIQSQGKSIFKIAIMASLLEKEAKTKEEKELVSGILWKRLEIKMPLQVDATIVYITGKRTTRISITETKIDSPYNTYKYLGLPLGPISNPGLESILAAVYPKDKGNWYYLSTPEGQIIFSKTLEEHNIAKAKYLIK